MTRPVYPSRMSSRSIHPVAGGAVVWLCLVAALFLPALLLRDGVPGGLNYLTLLFLPGVIPAVAGVAVCARLAHPRQDRSVTPRRAALAAFLAALVATAAILAVATAMDKDRAGGTALVGAFFAELFTFGLGNAVVAAIGGYWVGRRRLSTVRRKASSADTMGR